MKVESRKGWKICAILIAFAMVFTSTAVSTATVNAASAKKPTTITLKTNVPKNVVDIKGQATVSVKSVKPSNSSKKVSWKSSNKKVATVNSKGVVKGKKAGTVKITATSKADKRVTASLTLQVKNIKPTGVSLNKKNASLNENGSTLKLKATVKPTGVYNKGVTWSSSNKTVATVNSKGVVTPKKAGKATITVKTKEGKKTAKCQVTVKAKAKVTKTVLRPYMMVGYYAKDKLNYTDIASNAQVQVWDASTNTYKDGKNDQATILGNYVQLTDTNNDKKADLIEVVKFKDGSKKWNANLQWIDGLGKDTEPAVSDETGRKMFLNAEYRIPMGERLLKGFGLGDYSGTTDFSNLEESTYWTNYDYYNTKSSDSLTILPQYKTQLQTTGWTCVLSSALSVLDWYGQRGDLNEEDLAALRSDTRSRLEGGTSLRELETVFKKLEELNLTGAWTIESSFDNNNEAAANIQDPAWIKEQLAAGHPIMVIWNSYGGHGQVIIGYDDMGTPDVTSDDMLILMDPYDTNDHNADGYNLQSFERLAYGLSDKKAEANEEDQISLVRYLVAYPKEGWDYTVDRTGNGIADRPDNTIKSNDANKLNSKLYEKTAADLKTLYVDTGKADPAWIYMNEEKGLGGPAGVEHSGDYDHSPYYNFFDFYNGEGPTDTLKILKNFKTIQQSTEWTCGCTSATMVMEYFNKNEGNETDISLSDKRQDGFVGPTYMSGMKEIFAKMNEINNDDWVTLTRENLSDPDGEESFIGDYCLQYGAADNGLIPYLIEHNIPIIIGWDEWGGHWQTIIGYDDMGTPNTQDDVLVLADSYDTTDHDQDGYYLESFERLVYGWNVQFEKDPGGGGFDYNDLIVAFPREGNEDVVQALGLN